LILFRHNDYYPIAWSIQVEFVGSMLLFGGCAVLRHFRFVFGWTCLRHGPGPDVPVSGLRVFLRALPGRRYLRPAAGSFAICAHRPVVAGLYLVLMMDRIFRESERSSGERKSRRSQRQGADTCAQEEREEIR